MKKSEKSRIKLADRILIIAFFVNDNTIFRYILPVIGIHRLQK